MSVSVLTVRVARKLVEATDVCTFELMSADGVPLPAFSAGSHIDVKVPGGWTRQYSLCNDPADGHRYLIGVLKDPAGRGGSRAMHESVQEGDVIQISPPRNHFALAREARRSVLFAGGIGITPILCMAERLAMLQADFDLHYCARTADRMAFKGRIERSTFAACAHFHFDDGPVSQVLDIPALLQRPQADTHLYVCGPKGFMSAVLDAARGLGWAEPNLHFEYFAADLGSSDSDAAFEVKLAGSGRVIVVLADKTVVQALAEAGVAVTTSCEQGVCGTCVTRVLEGEVDHRDLFLTDEEKARNDCFTPCCSRARSLSLVLDL